MIEDPILERLTETAYDAVFDDAVFEHHITTLQRINVDGLTALVFAAAPDATAVPVFEGIGGAQTNDYLEYYALIDYAWPLKHLFQSNGPLSIFEHVSEHSYLKSEFYNDFNKNVNDLRNRYMIGVGEEGHGSPVITTTMSNRYQARVESRLHAMLAHLQPHYRRVFRLRHSRFAAATQAQHDLIHSIAAGALLASADGAIVDCNAEAERILRIRPRRGLGFVAAPRLDVLDEGLSALVRSLKAEKQPANLLAFKDSEGVVVLAQAVRLSKPEALVSTLQRSYANLPMGSVLVFLKRMDDTRIQDVKTLGTVYGLTAAEKRVVGRLLAGDDVRTAADALGISHNTARNQLAAAMAKLGVRRQADVVRRFSGII
ncbi:MAG: LuxR C-terminal-related transcriptional regulator [Pseudomonadota bacterium]